jgi:hypothetical protein
MDLDKEEKKSKTMISSDEFLKSAKPIKINIGGNEFVAQPQQFKSGSLGWGLSGKTFNVEIKPLTDLIVFQAEVGQDNYTVQISINLPIRGSKPAKKESDEEED